MEDKQQYDLATLNGTEGRKSGSKSVSVEFDPHQRLWSHWK